MTPLGNTQLRLLARKVLAQHAGPEAGTEALAAAARRAYDDLVRVTAPLIGQVGVDALTARAVHLALREWPRISDLSRPGQANEPFTQVLVSLQQQDSATMAEGAAAVIATLSGLLVTFIGEALTARLLRQAWPAAFSDASTEET